MSAPTSLRFSVAVHALTYLASRPDQVFGSESLARSTQASAVHLRKVLGPLREAGMVESRPGARGGWTLAQPASEITLADVWAALRFGTSVLGRHTPSPVCPVGREIDRELAAIDAEAYDAVAARLRRTTIADLVTPAMLAASPSL